MPFSKRTPLDWPFFDRRHAGFMAKVEDFGRSELLDNVDHANVDNTCRRLVAELGRTGLLCACVEQAAGGYSPNIESRHLTLAREGLAYHDGLADFAFAMQGLGSAPITLAGSTDMKRNILPLIGRGELIPAFALSEKEAGSDVGAMTCCAVRDGDSYIVNGEKTWISNGGIADLYVLFARTGEGPRTRGISAFLVYPDDPGFSISERISVMAPHPLATLRFENMKIPARRLLGNAGEGFKLAMRSLDIFRVSVAGAAVGFARRAFDEAIHHTLQRQLFGSRLADKQMTQAVIGDMAAWVDAAALLSYRAAWRRDVQTVTDSGETAMAKMVATENAQMVVDAAVQLFGARGVQTGGIMERLYREIRALRIYEGASEVQKLIISREVLRNATETKEI